MSSSDVRPASAKLAEAARPYAHKVGLVSIALCDHPDIERILSRLNEMGYSISPASLRLDDLTPTIVRLNVGVTHDPIEPNQREPSP